MPPTVVTDAGHGGRDVAGGSSPNRATGPNGLREKDLTLDLARRMRALLAPGLRVILTRDEDRNLTLSERARIARDSEAELFLSLHFDGAGDPDRDGTQPWIARSAPARVTGARARGALERDLGVLLP